MTYSVYVGLSNIRTIKVADWTSLGIANTGDTVWQSSNSWSIDEATLSAGQIAYLATQADFMVNQAVVRASGGAVDNPFGYVTNAALQAALRTSYVSDTGATQQWTPNTPANQGTIWAYLGQMYLRRVTGTDAVWTRANWTGLGADPTVASGGELAATTLATATFNAATAAFQDVTGLAVTPTVPANGRGIYVDLDTTVGVNVANTAVSYQLYDVTAGAAVPELAKVYCAATAGTYGKFKRWRLNPAAGIRTYKIQVATAPASNIGTYGADYNVGTGLYVVAR